MEEEYGLCTYVGRHPRGVSRDENRGEERSGGRVLVYELRKEVVCGEVVSFLTDRRMTKPVNNDWIYFALEGTIIYMGIEPNNTSSRACLYPKDYRPISSSDRFPCPSTQTPPSGRSEFPLFQNRPHSL